MTTKLGVTLAKRALRATLVALLMACASGARGQSADSQAAYDALVDSALRAAAEKNWPKARMDFEEASAVLPSAKALRGAGVVSFEMGEYARALRLLQRALDEPGRRLDGELRTATSKLAERAALRVGYYVIEANAPGVTVAVDGEDAVRDDGGTFAVDEGAHTIIVSAPGFVPRSLAVETRPSVTERWMVELEQTLAPADLPAPSPSPRATRSSHPDEKTAAAQEVPSPAPSTPRTITWIALGGAPVFAIGAGLAWLHVVQVGDEIASSCSRDECSPEERESRIQESSMQTYETLANVGIALVAASLVTAGVAYFVEGGAPSHPVAQGRPSGLPTTLQVRF